MKRTPDRGVKKILKFSAYKGVGVMFRHNDCVPIDEWANELLIIARLRQGKLEPKGNRV